VITVQDRIVVHAGDLALLRTLLRERYLPGAEARGLTLVGTGVSPPVLAANAPVTLWLRWQIADVGAWWAMRAQSGTPEVVAFWAEVDGFCLERERCYPCEPDALGAEQPVDESDAAVATRGYRETAQLALRDGLGAEQVTAFAEELQRAAQTLPGTEAVSLARNYAPEYAAGDFTLDLLYADDASAKAARQSAVWRDAIAPALDTHCAAVHALALDTIGAGLREPALSGSVKRTAFFRLLPGVGGETAVRFERDLLEMPLHIPEIRNWRLSRAIAADWCRVGEAPWSYVWEQEFADLNGLIGPYMVHPHHWGHIDRWFDPESGVQAIDARLSHAFSPLSSSLMSLEAVPQSR
tara:strand:- start:9671 stop:10729 length:1059 start_codon:yes stop_codon:yes gene_type:complete